MIETYAISFSKNGSLIAIVSNSTQLKFMKYKDGEMN